MRHSNSRRFVCCIMLRAERPRWRPISWFIHRFGIGLCVTAFGSGGGHSRRWMIESATQCPVSVDVSFARGRVSLFLNRGLLLMEERVWTRETSSSSSVRNGAHLASALLDTITSAGKTPSLATLLFLVTGQSSFDIWIWIASRSHTGRAADSMERRATPITS